MKKEVLSFRKLIQAGEKIRISERVKADGYIEEVKVRFYAGQEGTLRVTPYVFHKGKRTEHMLTYPQGTDNFLSGEDDKLEFPCLINIEYDDEIIVYVENVSNEDPLTPTGFPYTLVCDIVVTYYDETGTRIASKV